MEVQALLLTLNQQPIASMTPAWTPMAMLTATEVTRIWDPVVLVEL